MWDLVLLVGIVMLIIGFVKRSTDWGRTLAIVGAIGVVVSLVIAGPDLLEAFQRGFQDGYEAAQEPSSAD